MPHLSAPALERTGGLPGVVTGIFNSDEVVRDRATVSGCAGAVVQGWAHGWVLRFECPTARSMLGAPSTLRSVAATHLNDQQFAEMANAGGASRRMVDSKRPTSGLMVGVPGLEKRYPPPVEPYQVAHHRTLVAIHAGLGAGEYQGAWKTEHAGSSVVVLDHSKRFPDTSSGEALARRRGEAGHQDALWRVKGLDDGEEIPLH